MNFRFPRYVSDISILRAYQGADGSHGEYDASHVPAKPAHYLRVTLDGVKDGDFTLVVGNPGNTNRYRMSYSARYNLLKGIPDQIADLDDRARAAAALRGGEAGEPGAAPEPHLRPGEHAQVPAGRARRAPVHQHRRGSPRARAAVHGFRGRPARARAASSATSSTSQAAVYAEDVEANADLDAALGLVPAARSCSELALACTSSRGARAASDRERLPQFQERNWPNLRAGLLDDEPVLAPLEEDCLAPGLREGAGAAGRSGGCPPCRCSRSEPARPTPGRSRAPCCPGRPWRRSEARKRASPTGGRRVLARRRTRLVRFAVALEPTFADQRMRIAVLNEKDFPQPVGLRARPRRVEGRRSVSRRQLHAAGDVRQGGRVRNRRAGPVPFTTRLGGLFALADARGEHGRLRAAAEDPRLAARDERRRLPRALRPAARRLREHERHHGRQLGERHARTGPCKSSASSSTATRRRWRATGPTARRPGAP